MAKRTQSKLSRSTNAAGTVRREAANSMAANLDVFSPENREAILRKTYAPVKEIRYRVNLKQPHEKQASFIDSTAKRKIIRAGRRGGKTTGVAIYAVERFLRGRRILYAVPASDQMGRFWKEVCAALAEPIAARVYYKNETEHIIELPGTEQRIKAKTAWNADMLRGDSADDLILDEWQLMDEDAWEYIGAPMLIDRNGDAVFIYTPPSMHSKSVSKAKDPKHASKMFVEAQKKIAVDLKEGREPLWGTWHWTSLDNPFLSREGLAAVQEDMTQLAIRQEIFAEDLDEIPGALWTRELFDKYRFTKRPESLIRIGVGVDPSGGGQSECGIVAAGTAMCGCKGVQELHGFILEDRSLKASASVWAKEVHTCYHNNDADCVYGEKNFGGDMVANTIHTADAPDADKIRYEDVSASRGKALRAEPVVALYEQGKIHHVGLLAKLEDECVSWVPGISNWSPGHLDAMVWVLTKLMVGMTSGHLSDLQQPATRTEMGEGPLFDPREHGGSDGVGGAGSPIFSGLMKKLL